MNIGNETRAFKIFHNESQIKQGFHLLETEGTGMSKIKEQFGRVYNREAEALERIKRLGSENIVRSFPMACSLCGMCQ